jgi:RHS repeat-associated protein
MKIISLIFFILLITFKAYANEEPYLADSHEGAVAACNAHVASLGYIDNHCSYGLGWAASWNLCTSGTPYVTNCGEEPGTTPDRISIFYYYPLYTIGGSYYANNNSCTVGNPVDPVTGSKTQHESLVDIPASQSLVLDIYYNSSNLDKWKHSFSRRLTFSDVPTGSRYDTGYGSAHDYNPSAEPEAPSFIGGSGLVATYGKKPIAPQSESYHSKQDACELGWGLFKYHFKYSWARASVAEYRLTPISTYGAVGQCYILDAPEGEVKMVLDIHELFAGIPGGGSYQLLNNGAGNRYLRFMRPTGGAIVFSELENYKNISQTGETLDVTGTGTDRVYKLHTNNDEIETYSDQGKLLSIKNTQGLVQTLSYVNDSWLLAQVTNQTGEYITFDYEAYGDTNQYHRIKSIVDNNSRIWVFGYDPAEHNLTSVTFPDASVRQYHYDDENDIQLLTGITDENVQRYASWEYDAEGRATLSVHGVDKDKDRVEIAYADSYVGKGARIITTVRKSANTGSVDNIKSTYFTHSGGGVPIVAEITGVNPVKYEHNAITGDLEYKIEDVGMPSQQRTEYSNYDSKGNPGVIKEAVGTPAQRETSYTYDSRYHSKVATITESSVYPGNDKVTTNQYDDFGNNTSVTISGFKPGGSAVSRTTSFEYNGPNHQLTQIDGPRTDVNDIYTIDYYPDNATAGDNRARMKRVTAPLNITLYDNITYTPTGKINTYIDANNVQTTLSYYYGNDRLQTLSQLDLNTGEQRLTEWTYLATGEVKTVTTGDDVADKTTLTFNYDDARRLTSIVDGLGNTIEYILDSEGNVEQENIKDHNGVLKKQLTQTFDDYNRLQLRTQVNEAYTETWLPNGTLDKIVDGKNVTTDYSYDNLRRLTQINQDMGGISPQTADALTILNYDVQDNLTYVKNPVNGETIYTYDDLGNQLSRNSDDTGLTTYSHDDAGNITSMLDANGETVTYAYDALNRLTSITTSNTDDDYQYEYDNCQNGAGRLCKVSSTSSAQHYSYDAFGNVSSQQALHYAYDSANRLKTVSYPSGAIVHYDYDTAGQVSQVTLERNGTMMTLASNIDYEAFGGITNLLYGNGLSLSQSRDTAYRPLTQSILAVFELNYTEYDENGNLKQRNDAIAGSNAFFEYDAHNRLNAANGDFGVIRYEYDKNANRTKLTDNTVETISTYDPASNRLSMRGVDNASLDNNGNMLDLGDRGYSYTKHNRLFEVYDGGVLKATYLYNGLGQRISKILPDSTGKYFIYDTDGKLMAETDINGNVLFEYLYLNGQLLAKYTPDSDSDGISNYEEDRQGTYPSSPDTDTDGIADLDEIYVYGTSVSNADTDGDGISDGDEVALNSDPLNSNVAVGDINLDGEFNLGDYVLLSQYVLNIRVPTATEQAQADINQDGVLNIKDMLLMQRTLLGLQVSWSDFSVENIEHLFTQIYQGVIPQAYAANGDGAIYYVHNDHLGTPLKMTNEIGLVVWQAVYDPFGKATLDEDVDGDSKTVEMNVRFPGQYYDGESGLYYNYFRTYDPDTGRYITSDPIGLSGGINTYAYAGGNPLKYIDAYGLDYGFSVNPNAAGGNGHTTLHYQNTSGQWYSYDQGARGLPSSGGANIGFLMGLDAPAGVTIMPIESPPANANLYDSTVLQDALIYQSALNSMNAHNSGKIDYNLYNNNCTDAAVDVVNDAGINSNIPNPAFTVRPNSWFNLILGQ